MYASTCENISYLQHCCKSRILSARTIDRGINYNKYYPQINNLAPLDPNEKHWNSKNTTCMSAICLASKSGYGHKINMSHVGGFTKDLTKCLTNIRRTYVRLVLTGKYVHRNFTEGTVINCGNVWISYTFRFYCWRKFR